MAYTIPSRYQPIWDTLKEKRHAKLVAPAVLHKRIIKAVIKRKDVDVGYKFLCAEQFKKARIKYKTTGNIIEFYLQFVPYYNAPGAY